MVSTLQGPQARPREAANQMGRRHKGGLFMLVIAPSVTGACGLGYHTYTHTRTCVRAYIPTHINVHVGIRVCVLLQLPKGHPASRNPACRPSPGLAEEKQSDPS